MIRNAMKRLVVLALAWSALVVALLLFVPVGVNSGGCWRLVQPTPDCLDQLAALNARQWWTLTLPMLVFLSSGYVLIGAAMARTWLRRRRRTK